jgi:hypothetical protein
MSDWEFNLEDLKCWCYKVIKCADKIPDASYSYTCKLKREALKAADEFEEHCGYVFVTDEELSKYFEACCAISDSYSNENTRGKWIKHSANTLRRINEKQKKKEIDQARQKEIIDIVFDYDSIENKDLQPLLTECKKGSDSYCSKNFIPEYYMWLGLEETIKRIIRSRVTVAMNNRLCCGIKAKNLAHKAEKDIQALNEEIALVSGINDEIRFGDGDGCAKCYYYGSGTPCNERSHLCYNGSFYFIPR